MSGQWRCRARLTGLVILVAFRFGGYGLRVQLVVIVLILRPWDRLQRLDQRLGTGAHLHIEHNERRTRRECMATYRAVTAEYGEKGTRGSEAW